VFSIFTSEHGNARAAVRRALLDPDSAQFSGLRSVQVDAAKFVCGAVEARDRTGKPAHAPFVYNVAVDFARIDDSGRMTRQTASFTPCPNPADEKDKNEEQPGPAISPEALAMVKRVQKYVPKTDEATAIATLKQLASDATSPPNEAMERPVGRATSRAGVSSTATDGVAAASSATVGVGTAVTLRADQPLAAWPTYPAGHVLAMPSRQRTSFEALALAQDVEERWRRATMSGERALRPSANDIEDACRALLTIDPKAPDYAKAWAAFVRLQELDRSVAMR
jgi:hypothetical protein